ncbi:hypothetical protein M1D80_07965 [Phyllobacteriaceae bacterium JZ32]
MGQIVEKRNRSGEIFCGCNHFPDCRHSGGPATPMAGRSRRRA